MERIRLHVTDRAYALFLYLLMVLLSIALAFLAGGPIQAAIAPDRLAPDVRVGGLSLGALTEQEARQRLSALLRAAESKPIRLTAAERSWTLTPQEIGLTYDVDATCQSLVETSRRAQGWRKWWDSLLDEPVNPAVELKYRWDRQAAEQRLQAIKREADQSAANARLEIAGGQIRFTPHRLGQTVLVEESLKSIELALGRFLPDRTVALAVKEEQPAVMSDALKEIDTLLAQASTPLPAGVETARKNIAAAVARLDGHVIASRQVFSFAKEAGPFGEGSGYIGTKDEPLKHKEGGIQLGIGQTASTLYWAALKANLAIVERHAHLRPQPYAKPGLDAAIWDGEMDLKLENTFAHPVYIHARIDGNALVVGLYGNRQDKTDTDVVVKSVETFQPETVFLIDGELPTGEQREAQPGEEGVLAQVYRVKDTGEKRESGQEKDQLVSKDYYRPIPRIVYIGTPTQILDHGNGQTAIFGPTGGTSADSPAGGNAPASSASSPGAQSGGLGDFANDPNVARPADIPVLTPNSQSNGTGGTP